MPKLKKVNPKLVRSIIDHTTTCPYCGHRILHKNRTSHIKRQHTDRYESDILTAKLDEARKPAICSYCQTSMPIEDLESHIQQFHRFALTQAKVKIRDKERAERAEKRHRRLKMTREYEARLADSNRIDSPVKPGRPSGKVKLKKQVQPVLNKPAPKPDKKTQLLSKSEIGPRTASEPIDSKKAVLTPLGKFRCVDCGRDVAGQTVDQHQKDDFLLRTKVRWLLNDRNTSSVVLCPLYEIEIAPPAFSSHLEEKHPLFYRYAVGRQ